MRCLALVLVPLSLNACNHTIYNFLELAFGVIANKVLNQCVTMHELAFISKLQTQKYVCIDITLYS